MSSIRKEKIESLVLQELSIVFQEMGRNIYGNVMVSVTYVRVSADLSIARVNLSIFAAPDKNEVLKKIQQNTATFRYEFGKKVKNQLRIIPQLHFYLDDGLDRLEKLEKLIKS
jgi:ribosome-binding factor A